MIAGSCVHFAEQVGAVLQDGFDVRNESPRPQRRGRVFEQIGEELAMNAGRVGLVGMVGDADDVLGAFVDTVVDDAAGGETMDRSRSGGDCSSTVCRGDR